MTAIETTDGRVEPARDSAVHRVVEISEIDNGFWVTEKICGNKTRICADVNRLQFRTLQDAIKRLKELFDAKLELE